VKNMKSYSGKAKQYITNLLSKNKVKLEFENPKDLSNALDAVIRDSVKIHINEVKKSLCGAEMKEYDVFERKYLSNIKGYTYAWIGILADEKIAKQLQILKEAYYYFDGLLDLASPWAISYLANTNTIEGYYYSFSDKNLLGKDDEFVEVVYDSMSLSETSRKFLRSLRSADPTKFNVHYLAFDTINNPRKIGFRCSINEVLNSNIEEVYGDYIHLSSVIECLRMSTDYTTEVGFQFIPEKDYFGIDINVKNEDVMAASSAMLDMGIIEKPEYDFIVTLYMQGIDDDLSNLTWKFRWSSKNKFTIKHYNYFDRDKHPRFV